MRARLCLGWLVIACLVAGCDTSQPESQEQQTIQLTFNAGNARVQSISTWFVYEDSNGDMLPDDVNGDGTPDEYLWCDPQARYIGSRMPWSFSVQVDKVLAGETENITIARETEPSQSFTEYDAFPGSPSITPKNPLFVTNRTGYCAFNDDILCNPDNPATTICSENLAGVCRARGACSGDASVQCAPDNPSDLTCQNMGLGTCNNVPVTRTFRFTPDVRDISGANRKILSAPPNIVYITDPTASLERGPTGGVCPGSDLGPANVGGNAIPWSFQINKGDTIVVQARRFNTIPDGFVLGPNPPPISASVVYVQAVADPLAAQLFVDGAPAGTNGVTATTTNDPESYISFYFTSR